jgi:hypothetical protein
MVMKKLKKLTARLKNKTWTKPQIKNHQKNHEHRLVRPQTKKSRTHIFKYFKFLTPPPSPPTLSVQKIVNLLHGFNFIN